MSAKNKPVFKAFRRSARGENYLRTPVSKPVPQLIATKILTNPKYKVSAKTRRKLSLRRGVLVEVPRVPAKHPAVKLALRLSKLPMSTLFRRLKQSARRAATCKNMLSELSKGSQFAPAIEVQHIHEIGVWKQVAAEIKSRQ